MSQALEPLRQQFNRFFDGLSIRLQAVATARKELDRYLGSGFNVFGVFNPNENQVSLVLAGLLDPNGGHGQGTMFLRTFTELFPNSVRQRLTALDLSDATVFTEVVTHADRRIDLVVRFGDALAIGIENKPWAADQPAQLEDYAAFLEDRYKDFVLIYLSGYSKESGAFSISPERARSLSEAGHLMTMVYNPDLSSWLTTAALLCEAEKMRWFIRDFAIWVKQNFSQPILEKTQ